MYCYCCWDSGTAAQSSVADFRQSDLDKTNWVRFVAECCLRPNCQLIHSRHVSFSLHTGRITGGRSETCKILTKSLSAFQITMKGPRHSTGSGNRRIHVSKHIFQDSRLYKSFQPLLQMSAHFSSPYSVREMHVKTFYVYFRSFKGPR